MEQNIEQLMMQMAEKLETFAKTETVIGEEFKLGDFVCKPVIKVGLGFGGGSGDGDTDKKSDIKKGSGGMAGIGITPIGFLVSRGDEISFVSADRKKGLSAVFEKMPEMMDRMMAMKEKKDKETEK